MRDIRYSNWNRLNWTEHFTSSLLFDQFHEEPTKSRATWVACIFVSVIRCFLSLLLRHLASNPQKRCWFDSVVVQRHHHRRPGHIVDVAVSISDVPLTTNGSEHDVSLTHKRRSLSTVRNSRCPTRFSKNLTEKLTTSGNWNDDLRQVRFAKNLMAKT